MGRWMLSIAPLMCPLIATARVGTARPRPPGMPAGSGLAWFMDMTVGRGVTMVRGPRALPAGFDASRHVAPALMRRGMIRAGEEAGDRDKAPGAAAGLRPGDVIMEIDRRPVANADEAIQRSRRIEGDTVLLRVWSQGGSRCVVVKRDRGERFIGELARSGGAPAGRIQQPSQRKEIYGLEQTETLELVQKGTEPRVIQSPGPPGG